MYDLCDEMNRGIKLRLHIATTRLLFLSIGIMLCLSLRSQQLDLNETAEAVTSKVLEREQLIIAHIDSLIGIKAPPKQVIQNKLRLARYYSIYSAGNLEKAEKILQEVRQLAEENKDSDSEAYILTLEGIFLYKREKFDKALKKQFAALEISQSDDQIELPMNYDWIGTILSAKNNFDEAAGYFQKSIDIRTKQGRKSPKTYQRLARAYANQEMYDEATEAINQSIADAKAQKSTLIEGTSLATKADILQKLGRHQEAIDLLTQSYQLRQKSMTQVHQITLLTRLGISHTAVGEYAEAETYLEQALLLAKQDSSPGLIHQVLRAMITLDESRGDDQSALTHYPELIQAIDSFYDVENTEKFTRLYTELNVAQKENEILQQEIELKREKEKRNRTYGLLALLSALLVAGAYVLRRKLKYEKEITAQNEIITKALKEKEILLKEIHHRVKNNLQMVSSLLRIQSRSIKDVKAKEAIQEGRSRVHSMSLIHQNLYKKDNLTGIELKQYLPKLAKDLLVNYQYEEKDIELGLNVDDLKLDVESMIPIGLIVNELMTNCLKYAFEGKESGRIDIQCVEQDGKLILEVKDDGVGLDQERINQGDSFGHSLIQAFQDKLEADLHISGADGTTVRLLISKYQKV